MARDAPLLENSPHRNNGYFSASNLQRRQGRDGGRAGFELATRLFKGPIPRSTVAFASARRGEGVTSTVQGVGYALVRDGLSVAVLDGTLRRLADSASVDGNTMETALGLREWRDRYDAIVIDCGSLETSFDLLRIAREADGVVLVVEAGRTSKSQIDRAAKLVSEAGGNLLGFVLNKRRYPIPHWLYRLI